MLGRRRSRRQFLGALAAVLPLAAWAQPVHAGEEWCEDDPPLLLTTPHGHQLLVYVTQFGLGLQHLVDLEAATLSYASTSTNRPDGAREFATVFHVFVTIPDDPIDGSFAAKVMVSTGPMASGTCYASTSGSSGTTFDLGFTVPLA
jgi:hypothetical protein